MANPLTGQHDAVLQVSAGTINRLLATMHQNEGIPNVVSPTVPHSAFVRIGDTPATRVAGVQGSARVQAGVPQVELLHLAQDRVAVHIWLRARFIPSSGSAPFPKFVHGVLRAEYGLKEIAGAGSPHGAFFLPPRFVFDLDATRVSFKSEGNTSHDAAIAKQIVALLKTSFAMPSGHPMVGYLVDRKLISLSAGGSQAVAVGFELFPGPAGTERPRQIKNIVTAGRDFAFAAGREYILSLLRPQLDALEATTISAHVQFLVLSADYTIKITSATVQWGLDTLPAGGTCAAFDLTIQGKGDTSSSIAPNGTFTIKHRILLGFSPAQHSLFLVPKGGPAVSAHFGGIGLVESVIEDAIRSNYNSQLPNVFAAAAPQLAGISQFGEFLDTQLQISDDKAKSVIDAAEFTNDGLVLRGSVSLTPRARGRVQFDPLPDATGYGAFLSWFPGGRIVAFHWLWQPDPSSADVARQSLVDRFVIQPDLPMPGLPHPAGGPIQGGRVCLTIQGLVIDPATGAEVPAVANGCVSVQLEPPSFLEDIAIARLKWKVGADAVVEAGHGGASAQPFNTLLYHVGGATEQGSVDAVFEGIGTARRDDAGLLVLALIPEGGLDQPAAARLRDAAAPGEAVVRVVEDSAGEWAQAFRVSAGEGLRLVTADGRPAWSHDGPIDPGTLSAALREHLVPSPSPRFLPLRPEAAIGRLAPEAYLDIASGERLSLAHLRGRPVTLCFALPEVESSLEQFRRLRSETDEDRGFVAVILTDGDATEAAGLADTPEPRVVVAPDPHRSITGAFGVHVWPTTITIDEAGIVASVTTGFHPTYEPETSA